MSVGVLYFIPESIPTFRQDIAALFNTKWNVDAVRITIVGRQGDVGQPPDICSGQYVPISCSKGLWGRYIQFPLACLLMVLKAESKAVRAIQVRDMPVLGVLMMLCARLRGFKFYYWMSYPLPWGLFQLACARVPAQLHKFLGPLIRGGLGIFLMRGLIFKFSDHLFVQSDRMGEQVLELGASSDRISAWPMGVDFEAAERVERLSTGPAVDSGPVLCYLGTMVRPRRIEVIFETFSKIRSAFPMARLLLVGDTNDSSHRAQLEAKLLELGIAGSVDWHKWLPIEEAWALVSKADVGFSTFPRGFLLDGASPTKVPEYIALGVPVVANDNPDQKFVLDLTGAGRCVALDDKEFLAATLEILQWSRAHRSAVMQRARQVLRAERSYDVISARLCEFYTKLLKEPK